MHTIYIQNPIPVTSILIEHGKQTAYFPLNRATGNGSGFLMPGIEEGDDCNLSVGQQMAED